MPTQTPDWKSLDGKGLLDALHRYAISEGVSDIHASPEKGHVRFEVRLHGALVPLSDIDPKVHIDLMRRVKFLSRLKLNIDRAPQDGQYTVQVEDGEWSRTTEGRQVNVRVATLPSRFGETLTLRLLDPKRGIVPLEELGFAETTQKTLGDVMQMPNGLLLITGPTGSGKTTTLYALLQTVIGTGRNIITLEDPVEYEIEGIVQSQVDPDHDYDFARGLRAALRHDPDIILVGEIRDQETAQTVVDAALTGHLVLSTLHTNSAIEAITRFLAMGISPHTFGPALRAVLGQRLVRTIAEPYRAAGGRYDPSDHRVYDGRTSISELLFVSPGVRECILNRSTSQQIEDRAKNEQYRTMHESGEALVKQGVTNETEVMRVTR